MAEENDKTGRDEALNEDASTPETADDATDETPVAEAPAKAGKFDRLTQEEGGVRKLTGMYKNWFLDYASYVILERAVPHVEDGLKPVQRRILHAMKVVDDGRYNKVANLVGQTMQYHPHGDASIKDALVQLGQKDLLIDCQGNWGNILTGDEAAAGRYIEARLSKFALDVVFNKKTTEWMLSYDGRKEEPVTLPIKFPLLLAQGSDGIAVGLASKILPHNFVELINAAIAHLQGRDFQLYPDFPTGGMADVSRYNDGLRGGPGDGAAARGAYGRHHGHCRGPLDGGFRIPRDQVGKGPGEASAAGCGLHRSHLSGDGRHTDTSLSALFECACRAGRHASGGPDRDRPVQLLLRRGPVREFQTAFFRNGPAEFRHRRNQFPDRLYPQVVYGCGRMTRPLKKLILSMKNIFRTISTSMEYHLQVFRYHSSLKFFIL